MINFKNGAVNLLDRYSKCFLGCPVILISTVLSFSFFLTVYALYFNFNIIDFDPTKGFETRGTPLSAARLTLEALKPHQATNEQILRWFFEQQSVRKRRNIQNITSTTTLEPLSINYDDYGVDSSPNVDDLEDSCEQFGSIGKSIPYDAIEYLAKIMVKISSYDQLFSVEVMKHLCEIDSIIDDTIIETNYTNIAKHLKHSFNIPLYTTCPNISIANSCDSINQETIVSFRELLETCRVNETLGMCDAFSINQVINWALPQHGLSEPPTITIILKIAMWNGVDREFYDQLLKNIDIFLNENSHTTLVGASFNMKDEVFKEAIFQDMMVSGMSAILVLICFFFYSQSIIFTSIIIITVGLSAGVAFFIYTCIFSIDFFPFINLLVMVLLISIGADDAFLLLVYFRKEVEKLSNLEYKVGSIYVPLYREYDLLSRSLIHSLRHSLVSMFVTSLTTAITFLTNLASPVIVLRCFGIYACLTVFVNYILVILILPATIILTRPLNNLFTNLTLESIFSQVAEFTNFFRHALVFITFLLTGLAIFVIFKNPGLAVPQTNPTKLLIDNNIHEFYDNNVHRFNFEWKRSARLVKNFLFGVEPVEEKTSLSPYRKPKIDLSKDEYELNLKKLEIYKILIEKEYQKYKSNGYNYTSWAEHILKSNETCLNESDIHPECLLRISVKTRQFVHQFPDDFAVLPGDGPFFSQDLKTVGYFISIPTNEKLRIDADVTERIFEELDKSCDVVKNTTSDPVLCLSSTEITRFYDIISQIRHSSLLSVVISIIICLFVIIICTRVLKLSLIACFVILSIIVWTIAILILFGWKLSVVESTVLIITIGLSFDYTLHYAMAIRDTKYMPTVQKISTAHSTAGVACSLGSLTLIVAGFPLLFCQTASFYQIGSMLCVLGITSLFGASIILPAFVDALSCNHRESTKL